MSQSQPMPTTGFATRAIHHGYDPKANQGALVAPLHMSSTFVFDSAEHGAQLFAGEQQGYIYTRLGNPTQELLETRLASLEGGEAALATASGMGAITAALWTLVQPGDEVIVDKTLYGCTFAFFRHGLDRFGVKVTHIDLTHAENLANAISAKTKVVYFETPANPNMRIVDIAAISAIAHRQGATVMVDNTYCTPYLQQPLKHGADLVVHSATKYLGGHGDLIAGAVIGRKETTDQIRLVGIKDMTGACIAPMNAFLITRGLKTLALRMDRHCQSAQMVAEYLEAQPEVASVAYPGLTSFPQHDLAKRQMSGFGGMIAFELTGGKAMGAAFINALSLITRAVSLGDAETLIQHPATMTHSTYSAEERAEYGITDGLVRLSVGLENVEDILADLAQAFAVIRRAALPRAA